MANQPSTSSPSDYLESLMRAGEEANKHFDDAIAAAMGLESKPAATHPISPFAAAASLQQQYWAPVLDFWRGFFETKPAAGANAAFNRREATGASRTRPGLTRLIMILSSNPIC